MNRIQPRIVGGALLIAGGLLVLLQTLGILTQGANLPLAILVGAGGVFFVYVLLTGPSQKWWAAIPGVILLDLMLVMLLELFFPEMGCSASVGGLVFSCSELAGTLFLGGIGLSFWIVYIVNRAQWWAVIPAGVLTTLAAVTLLSQHVAGSAAGGIFFVGLGLTFVLVALLPSPQGKMGWAFIPAAILLVMGIFLIGSLTALTNYVWALALIGVGVWLLLRALRRI
jgi:hypothetical protein